MAGLAGGLAQAQAQAQDAAPSELDLFKLDAVLNAPVVTASGVEEERSISPANVYSITREEILAKGWRSVAEAISSANVPGLYVIDDLVVPSIGVRGVTGGVEAGTRIVKVMIDGQAVNFRPLLTAFLGPEFIPMEAVERIEIAKGPLSALYGANAFLATVNVITRKPKEGPTAELGARATVINRGGYGASGLVSYGGRLNALVSFGVDEIDRSGLRLQQTFAAQNPDQDVFQRETTGDLAKPATGFVKISANGDRWGSLTLEGGYQRLDSNGNFVLNSLLTNQTRITQTNIWTNGHYEKQWSKVGFGLSFGYSQGQRTRDHRRFITGNNAYTFKPNNGYRAVDASADVTYSPLGDQLSLRAGIDFEWDREDVLYWTQTFNQSEGIRRSGEQIDLIGAGEQRHQDYMDIGAFLQASSVPIKKLPGLHLTGNLRIDKITFGPVDFGVQYSWRVAVAYRWNKKWTTKLFAGRAFQTPSGVLLFAKPGFGTNNNLVGSETVPGLAQLRPQAVTSVEAVVAGKIWKYFTLELAIYYQHLEDKIEFIQNGFDFVAANRGLRQSFGVEGDLRFTYRRWSAFFNVAVEAALAADGGFDNKPAALYPRTTTAFGFAVDVPEAYLRMNTQARAIGPRGASQSNVFVNGDRYYQLNTYGAWDITISSKELHLFGPNAETTLLASGRNLLGTQWSNPGFGGFDIPNIGRNFYFEIRQTF
jgi:iron complex outermembrane receptor protein